MLVPAAWRAWRHGSLGPTRARYVPLVIAVIYPCLQLARFAPSAAEVADRASTFVDDGDGAGRRRLAGAPAADLTGCSSSPAWSC